HRKRSLLKPEGAPHRPAKSAAPPTGFWPHSSPTHGELHAFPTRRSSDLGPVDGVYTFTDGNGLLEEIDTNAEAIAYSNATSGLAAAEAQAAIDEPAGGRSTIDLGDNGDGKVTLVKPDGTTATVDKSDVTPNGDGTYTFTNNDGGDVIIDANTLTITEAGGVYTFTDGNGLPEEIDTNAERSEE